MPDAIKEAFSAPQRNSQLMISFGQRLNAQFSVNKANRRAKELEWTESLRQYKGLYDPEVARKIDPNSSKVYPKLTRSKVNLVLSRLHEMLFPASDKNWEIKPTPDPSIPKEDVKKIALSLVTRDESGAVVTLPTEEDLRIAIKKFATKRCENMAITLDDQLTEMDYPEETKKVLRSGLMYGTGIMKGPLIANRTKRQWRATEGEDFEEAVDNEEVPELKAVRIWDWYPDMSVTDQIAMEGSFERHIMTKHDLRQLMKREDFYPEMIEEFLTRFPNGNYTPENWETELQVIEIESGGMKGDRGFSTVSTGTQDSRNTGTNRQLGKKYEVLEFWGYVDGADLTACGENVADQNLEYAANIWLIGDTPIKTALYPAALDQYKLFYYEKDETSIYGEGLARVMRHSQLAISGGARMVLNNGAITSGPQVEVNWSLMQDGSDITSLFPGKIWYRKGTGVDAQYAAVRALNFDSHIPELLSIIDAFKQFADEETCLPTWMIGQQVNNETAQATSGRNATILVSIKDVVKNFDSFTENIMRDLYAWNMDFNKDESIKGDFKCKARGVSSLVMKEIRMQALTQLTSTMTPAQWDYIPERDFLSEKLKAHDIYIDLLTEDEVTKKRQLREQSVMNQLQIEMVKSEIGKNKAQALSLQTKAKEHNVKAIKEAQTPPETSPADDPRLADAEVGLKLTDQQAKEAEIRRKEEAHKLEMQGKMQDMGHKDEQHRVGMATDMTKTAHEVANKAKVTDHSMKMKEKLTDVAAKAKKTAASKPKKAGGVKK